MKHTITLQTLYAPFSINKNCLKKHEEKTEPRTFCTKISLFFKIGKEIRCCFGV